MVVDAYVALIPADPDMRMTPALLNPLIAPTLASSGGKMSGVTASDRRTGRKILCSLSRMRHVFP